MKDGPERFVFIVTYGRSGSTLLQNLLNALPGYLIRGENENTALHLALAWQAVAGSEQIRRRRRAGVATAPQSPWFGAERIETEAYGRALAESFVRHVLRPDPGTRVAGFKEIRYHFQPKHLGAYLGFLADCFPDARFVFNTRDHAAVARSGWWQDTPPGKVKAHLARAEGLYREFQAARPELCLALHYDDYVAEPGRLEALFAFLDEPWDAALVERVMAERLDHLRAKESD